MLTRKKSSCRIDNEKDFASNITTRTFNVRRTDNWSPKVLNNIEEEGIVAVDYDEHDKKQQSFFECDLPESNDEFLFGSTEELPPSKSVYTPRKILVTVPITNFASFFLKKTIPVPYMKQEDPVSDVGTIDIIQLSDDEDRKSDDIMIVEEVIKPFKLSRNAREQRLKRKVDKLSAFLKRVGIEETNNRVVEEEKEADCCMSAFLEGLEGEYLAVCRQMNRRKTMFLVRPEEMHSTSNTSLLNTLLDPPVPKKISKQKTKKQWDIKEMKPNKKVRSPSPVLVSFSSDDDDPPVRKETETKKVSSAPKQPANGKASKRVEDEVQVVAPPAGGFIVPKKDPKLRSNNLNELLRNKTLEEEARRQREKLAAERKRRETADELVHVKGNNKKDGPLPPIPSAVESSEPVKKRVRLCSPPASVRDIIGAITSEMDAALEAAKKNEIDTGRDEWVAPRYEPHMPPTSLPPRFEKQEEDEDMDICGADSPLASPVRTDKTVSPASSDSSGMEVDRRHGHDGISPTIKESNEIVLNDRRVLNLDEETVGDVFSCENFFARSNENHLDPKIYRLVHVDGVSRNGSGAKGGVTHWEEDNRKKEPKLIPIVSDGTATDPRKGAETRVEKKKKGVKWGDTATKEFNPDVEDVPIEVEKKSNEVQEVTGERAVGGKTYKIVKKVVCEPQPVKSCLVKTPSTTATGQSHDEETEEIDVVGETSFFPSLPSILNPTVAPSIRLNIPPISTPMKPSRKPLLPYPTSTPKKQPSTPILPYPTSTPIKQSVTPLLPDFLPPINGKKVDEKSVQAAKEWKDKEEGKAKEEKEKRAREEEARKKRREREEEETRGSEWTASTSSSPEGMESSSMRDTGGRGGMRTNRGGLPHSVSMGNVTSTSSKTAVNGDLSGCHSMTNLSTRGEPIIPHVRGSEIVGDITSRESLVDAVKYQLEMRTKLAEALKLHKTLRNDYTKNEYPVGRMNPSTEEQKKEQEQYNHELTMIEKDWKRDGIQPVWMQSLPLKTKFSFKDDDGLYWPVVQATDKVNVEEKDFESVDVIRSLGNHTHFATEKKALLGVDTRLPNGMTHKERVEALLRGDKTESRFKNRRMYSRVFPSQSEEDARIENDKRKERDRRLLREHEEVIKKNAPLGVSIEPCRMPIGRPDGFACFNNMVQFYKNDKYETDGPYSDPDWYCTKSNFYMPYTERVNYLCKLINHYNSDYNALYEEGQDRPTLITLDLAAFAASQIEFGQMEPFKRVGVSEDVFRQLMKRHKERMHLIDTPSGFELTKYGELCDLDDVEHPFFHFIIDSLSSIFDLIEPLSDWPIEDALNSAFRENVILSEKKDRTGRARDAREVFYESYKAAQPSSCKQPRLDDEYDNVYVMDEDSS